MGHKGKVKMIFTYGSQTLESLEVILESLNLKNISDSRVSVRNLIQYLIRKIVMFVLSFRKKIHKGGNYLETQRDNPSSRR